MGKSNNQRVWISFVLSVFVMLAVTTTNFASVGAAVGDVTIIYDDTLATNWAEAGFARTFFPSQTGTVHAGNNAIETTIDSGGIVYLEYNGGAAFPDANINTVRFWIHGGTGGDVIKFSLMPAAYDFDTHATNITLVSGWQQIEVPFSQFGAVSQVTGLAWTNTGSSTSETLYIDEIEFVEAAVATNTPTAPAGNTSTPTPTVPAGTVMVYSDSLASNWAESGFARTFFPSQNGTAYSGSSAIETTIDGGGIVYLEYNGGTAYPDSSLNVARFWIHGGTGGDTIKFSVMPAAYDFDSHFVNLTLAAGWQQVEVPFSQFGTVAQVTGLAWTNTGSSTSQTLFIDEIELANNAVVTPTLTPSSGDTQTPTPSVPTGAVIYADTLATNWAEEGFSRTFIPSQNGTVYSGSNAIEITIDSGGIVYLNYNGGTAYPDPTVNTVSFWIHGGTGGDTIKFSVMPAAYDFDSHVVNITLAAGWQQVEVPFSQFGTVAQVTGIAWTNTGSSTSQTLFIDEVEFSVGTVATATPTPSPTPKRPYPISNSRSE